MSAVDRSTLTPFITRYVISRRQLGELQPTTAAQHRRILGTFAESFGCRPVERLSRRDVERWQESRAHVAAGTRRLEYGIVRAFTSWLVAHRIIKRDPTAEMRTPRVPRSVPRALQRSECDRIAEVLPDDRARVIVALLRRCGLRRAEVAGMQVGDYDPSTQVLFVTGKGGHERYVPAPADVAALLDRWCDTLPAGPMVPAAHGGHMTPTHLGRLVTGWMRLAGVKSRAWDGRGPHSLRHTIATEVVDAGGDVRAVQVLLGHRRLTSTEVYLRRADLAAVRAALDLASSGNVIELAAVA